MKRVTLFTVFRIKRLFALTICLGFLGFGLVAEARAATYYVAPDGNDDLAGDIGHPWETIYKATQALVAGDFVYVRAGTYLQSDPLVPLNSGTPGKPITFAAYPGETPLVRPTVDYAHDGFRFKNHSYITIDGLEISHFYMAGIHFMIDHNSDHIIIKNCHIHDGQRNHHCAGIYSGNGAGAHSTDCQFLNNVLHDNRGASTNSAGILFYDMHNATIRGNTIYNQSGCGIMLKYRNSNCDVSQNTIYSSGYAIWCGSGSDNCDLHENIIYDCGCGFRLAVTDIVTGTKVYNNVLHNCGININDGARDQIIYNNVLVGGDAKGRGISRLYDSVGTIAYIGYNNLYNCTYYDVEPGENDIYADPQFVNSAIHDYHLQSSSPCKGIGRYGKDLGAYPGGSGPDDEPPYTQSHNPASNQTNVPINTQISFHVKDSGDGVDRDGIELRVNNEEIAHASLQITGDSSDYAVIYDPYEDFGYKNVITVSIDAKDLHDPPNIMPTYTYSFTTKDLSDIENFTIIPGDRQVALSWTIPDDEDYAGVEIRCFASSDTNYDQYPATHEQGELVCKIDRPGNNCLHTEYDNQPLINGHRHNYSAFSYDAYGNYGTTAHGYAIPTSSIDTIDPTVTISSPTSGDTYITDQNTITLGGTASDNVGVTGVTWVNNPGGGATASGTDTWTISNISLQEGDNVITVTARDAAGNTGTDNLIVTYSPSGEQTTVTLQQGAGGYDGSVDSWISSSYADRNYGDSSRLHLQGWSDVSDRALFNFDMSSVPANATVTNATFEVYISETNSDYETVGLYNILTSWNEGTVTYNSPWSSPGLESGTDYEAPYDQKQITSTGFASFDITNLVQQWVRSSTNNGFFLKCDTHIGGHYEWHSSEWSDTNLRPRLTVTYTTGAEPDTTDPTVTITQPTSEDTYHTEENSVTLGGSASDNINVTGVTWTNNRGGSGTALETEKWTISGISLQEGDNVITVTAHDAAGNTATDALTVTYAAPDTTDPTVTITSPTSGSTYSTSQSTTNLGGTASDNAGVTSVTWTNNRGGDGTALGTDNWTVSNISLQEGDNAITVTAHDAVGNTSTDTLTVTYSPPDTTDPTVSITSPTSGDAYSTEQDSINMGGTAADNIGVTGVTWTNNRGGIGTATGTENWTISGISLQEGDNVISVTAHDATGNIGSDILTVSYTPSTGTYTKQFGSATSTDYPGTLQDTSINLNTTNYVSDNFVNTYTWPQDKVANAIIMKWDLSAIPSSATIQNATLYLYLSDMEVGGGEDLYDLSVHKIINYNPVIAACTGHTYDGTNSWTPNTQCDDNIPMAQADIAQAEDTEAIDKTHGYKSWSVINMVQDWVSGPGTNYGMLVNSDSVASSDSNRYFNSTESSNPDQRPKLVVTYTVGEEPDTTGPTITITQPTSEDTYHTEEDSVTLGGIASDNVGVSSVTWTNNQGGSGTASGTINWTISDLPLHCGEDNIITVSATDASGNTGTDTITVDVKPFPVSGLH